MHLGSDSTTHEGQPPPPYMRFGRMHHLVFLLDNRSQTFNKLRPVLRSIEQTLESDSNITSSRMNKCQVPYSEVPLLNCAARRSYLTISPNTSAVRRNASFEKLSPAMTAETRGRARSATSIIDEGQATSKPRHAFCSSVSFVFKTVYSNGSSAAFQSARFQSALPSKLT